MALLFSGTSDRVNHGSASVLDDNIVYSLGFWMRWNSSYVDWMSLFNKEVNADNRHRLQFVDTSGGDIILTVGPAGVCQYTAQGIVSTQDKWYYIVLTVNVNGSSNDKVRFYVGDLTTVPSLWGTVGVSADTGAASINDASASVIVGNNLGLNANWEGDIAFFAYWDDVRLTLDEIRQQQFQLWRPVRPTDCPIFSNYGLLGADAVDWSGSVNNGTVTGATQSAHVPVPVFPPNPGFFPTMTPRGSGALRFADYASSRVVIPDDTSIDDFTACTAVAWVYPTTRVATRRVFQKGSNVGGEKWKLMSLSDASGNLSAEVTRVTQNAISVTNTTPLSANAWGFVAMTYDETNGVDIYWGDLSNDVAVQTYAGKNVGSGATTTDNTGVGFIVGNDSSLIRNFSGRIGYIAYFNGALTVDQLRKIQYSTRPPIGATVGIDMHLGQFGADAIDWSGNENNGTVYHAEPDAGVPLPLFPSTEQFFPTMTPRGSGALRFVDKSTHAVNHGTLGGANPTQGTFLLWVNPTSQPNAYRNVINKGLGIRITVGVNNTFSVFRQRATTSQNAVSNNGAWTTGWGFYAGVIDITGGLPKVYKGTLTSVATDVTNTTVVGSGTPTDYSSADFTVGDYEGGWSAPMDVSYAALFDTDLSLAEIRGLQFQPWAWGSHPNCLVATAYGQYGWGEQPDFSGNAYTGTPNIAEMVAGVPLPLFPSRPSFTEVPSISEFFLHLRKIRRYQDLIHIKQF